MQNQSLILVIDWAPTIEIIENGDEWSAVAKLPDVIEDELLITIDNGVLTLLGKRNVPQKADKNPNFAYGNFVRTLHLPTYVDCANACARLQDEILMIRLPMLEKQKRIKVPIITPARHDAEHISSDLKDERKHHEERPQEKGDHPNPVEVS